MGQGKLDSGQDVVFMVNEAPQTLDKPRFNFSKVSYKQSREMTNLQTRVQQKGAELQAALGADDIEDLIDQLEKLQKELNADPGRPEREHRILTLRINRLEQRIDQWVDVDVDSIRNEFNALMDQQETQILAGVEYLPQAWLIDSAPPASTIDWSNHESLKWLRGDKFQTLAKEKGAAQNNPN